MTEPLLEVDDLTLQYRTKEGPLTAVSDASFEIHDGEYFGLVGESGCGKSTLAQSLLGAMDANGIVESGTIKYRGEEIQDYSEREFNESIRWKEISWIPQGSMESLDPVKKVKDQALGIANKHTDLSEGEALERFKEMFDTVGLQQSRINDYPHELSGGMQQRVVIALALFLEPKLIIADEPTTALDVIMQDQIFKYLDKIKEETNNSMLLITHDISLVFESCRRMAIMHSGQVAETGPTKQLYDDPRHPYAILLQESFPDIRYPKQELSVIEGYPPQTMGTVDYCTFADRCPWAVDECRESAPPLDPVSGSESHFAGCIRKEEVHRLHAAETQGIVQQPNGGDIASDE